MLSEVKREPNKPKPALSKAEEEPLSTDTILRPNGSSLLEPPFVYLSVLGG